MARARSYLDFNATSPLRPAARARMIEMLDLTGNPSSVHAEGRRARAAVENARSEVAQLVGTRADLVTFTSGTTEAAALALTP
jgi:cysteine desulfurase